MSGGNGESAVGVNAIRTRVIDSALPAAAWALDMLIWDRDTALRTGGDAPLWLVPVISAVVFALLLLRRRYPATIFAVQWGWATVGCLLLPEYVSLFGVLIALYTLAGRRRTAWSASALAACALPAGIQAYDAAGWPEAGPAEPLAVWILWMLAAATAWWLGHRNRCAELRVALLEARREAETAQALRTERLRIARELHDIVAHSVSVMVLQAAGARAVLTTEPERSDQALAVIQQAGTQSLSELRRLLGLLRSASGEDMDAGLDRQPSLDEINPLLENARAAGLAVTTHLEGIPGRVDPSVGLAAYRLIQETLTNTMKHAGPGAGVQVRLTWSPEDLTIDIQDQAEPSGKTERRLEPVQSGYGLLGLRERVTTVGGTFEARTVTTGFVVRAVLPLVQQPYQPTTTTPLSTTTEKVSP